MRIGFTGGGTGGHFYPLIAVAEALNKDFPDTEKYLYYFGNGDGADFEALKRNQINFIKISAGKNRLYFSMQNFTDMFRTLWGVVEGMFKMAIYYPDVIFSKGGYVAFPVLFVSRILRIPIIIHDSDTIPGRVTLYASKFAKNVLIAWPECGEYLVNSRLVNPAKIQFVGLPIRQKLLPNTNVTSISGEFSNLKTNIPTLYIVGGSQGSERLNEAIMASLPIILPHAQIIHQTGKANFEMVKTISAKLLEKDENKNNYFPIAYLEEDLQREVFQKTSLVICRGGSQILEFFCWGLPSIMIPIPKEISRDQTTNSFAAMQRGAAFVIEEKNLTPRILQNEVLRLLNDHKILANMSASARQYSKTDASNKVAELLINTGKSHQ
jgi:UDP-N-acetylglucosamine--N-acetylmuramyl-(pentapeptide) pyrophosphoryl-undecaprenol N-acetylglucosamine transferase